MSTPTTSQDAPAAVVHIVVLTDDQRETIIRQLRISGSDTWARLADYLEHGEEYLDPLDEFVRLTLRKRQLETELNRIKNRLGDQHTGLMAQALEDFAAAGIRGAKHDATGKTVSITRRIWARVARQGEHATPEEKARAADALEAAGFGDFLERGFNVNTLSGYFRDEAKRHLAEHGTPADIDQLLPAELKGAIALTEDHTLSVRS